ncbi:MAG TPA: hypothetical protein VJR29_11530, partial [bacterium]|nr:hypothetical protein [bacterium]
NVGALDNAWDKIWRPEVTEADKILKSETIRLNLVSAVRARLESGKFKTIMEALKDVYAGSDAELKDAALEVMATSGLVMPFGSSRAGRLAAFGSSTQPDAESSAALLKDAKELSDGSDEQKKAAAGIYRMVHLLSRDASHKEEARQALEAK